MKITEEHAVKRIQQIGEICLHIFKLHEQEAEQEKKELQDAGADVEAQQVTMQMTGNTVYSDWQKHIIFYSQYLAE